VLSKLLQPAAAELARVDAIATGLVCECDPLATEALLEDWERLLGLPDPRLGIDPSDIEARRAMVWAMLGRGGQSRAYFEGLAAKLGITAEVIEFRPAVAGGASAGDPLYTDHVPGSTPEEEAALVGLGWRFAWGMLADQVAIAGAEVGIAAAGDPLRTWGNSRLETIVAWASPAHTNLHFYYRDPEA
jgi:uncharacterized protein YmfQ (DUF2313 family)